ncbi:MAG: N-acetylmuramoyl-L-alanine amidase family protein [Paraclostridium sp.]
MSRKKVIKKKVIKKKVKKSRVTIVVLLLLISIVSLSYATKNIVTTFSSMAISKSKEKEKAEQEKVDDKEIEQLTLDKEDEQKKFKIVVDAAHGGEDSGKTGFSKKTLEKDVSLQISKKVASKLAQYKDIEVILTRSEDITLSKEERVNIANSQKADLLVSIHLNGEYGGGSANGTETYYQQGSVDNSDKLAKSIQDTVCLYLETRNRGVIATNIDLLKNTTMPSASIEVGFITNEEEEKKLKTNSYQEKMADGIAQGILSYVDSIK